MKGLHGIIFSCDRKPGLRELVEGRMPGAIPFGGRYRIVDFMLSSLQNAGVTDVGVVLSGNYQSLLDHIGNGKTWDMSRKHGGLRVLPLLSEDHRCGGDEPDKNMRALAGVRPYLDGIRQDYVVLTDSDLVVNIDLADVLRVHVESGADITCVCTAHYEQTSQATFFQLDADNRVLRTLCSPQKPEGCHGLEIYLLSKELLIRLVDQCEAEGKADFRGDVLNGMGDRLDLRAYVYRGFAAQIRTVREYYDRSMALLQPRVYRELSTAERPIRAKEDDEPPTYIAPESRCVNSLIADGCEIAGTVENSILFSGVRVKRGAVVRNSVLLNGTLLEEDAAVRYLVADKNVTICRGSQLIGQENDPMVIAKGSAV